MGIIRFLDRHLEEIIITTITSVMLFALFFQVIARFILHAPLAWSEELSINLMPWLCYFGSSLAVRENAHLKVEIITNFLSEKGKTILELIGSICFLLFAMVILYYTSRLTIDIFNRSVTTAVLQWPKWVVYGGIPIAFLTTTYRLVFVIKHNIEKFLNLQFKQKREGSELE